MEENVFYSERKFHIKAEETLETLLLLDCPFHHSFWEERFQIT